MKIIRFILDGEGIAGGVEDTEALPGVVDAQAGGSRGLRFGVDFFVVDLQTQLRLPDIDTDTNGGGLFRVDAVFEGVFHKGDEEERGDDLAIGVTGDGEGQLEGAFETGLL